MGKRNKEELHLGLRDALEHGIVRNRQKPRTTRSRQSRAVGPAHRQKPPNKQRADRGSEIGVVRRKILTQDTEPASFVLVAHTPPQTPEVHSFDVDAVAKKGRSTASKRFGTLNSGKQAER